MLASQSEAYVKNCSGRPENVAFVAHADTPALVPSIHIVVYNCL